MRQVAVYGLVLVIGALVVGSAEAVELVKLGIKGGVSLARLNDEGAIKSGLEVATGDAYEQGTRLGPIVGGWGQFDVSPNWALRPEVLYVAKGETYSSDAGDVTAQFDYLEVPLLVLYRFPSSGVVPAVFAGPSIGFEMAAEYSSDELDADIPDTKGTDISFVFGAEATFNGRYSIEARIWNGFTDLSDSEDDAVSIKNQGAALLVGVAFDLPHP
jgi:hypothetical protein